MHGWQSRPTVTGEVVKRLFAAIARACALTFGVALALLAAGCSGQNADETEPMVVTEAVNGTVKVTTTGP